MGVAMCSCQARNNIRDQFQCTEEMYTTEEQEDTDLENEYFNLGRMNRSITMPDELRLVIDQVPKTRRVKSAEPIPRESSKQKKIKDWHRSSVVNPEGELQAKRYSKMIADDSLKHLRQTIRTASSIVDKGTAINNELARQENVLSKAEYDIAIAEYDTDQTTNTLKGMKSLKGKLANVIWKKEPKLRINEFSKESSTFSNVNLNMLEGDVGLCAFSNMQSSKATSLSKDVSEDTEGTAEAQIKAGMGQLHKALDAISLQQLDTALTLNKQDGRLSVFENRMSSTQSKINYQSQMINSIMGK